MEKVIKNVIFLFILVLNFGCETKEYQNEKTINFSGKDLNEGKFNSSLNFSGATSIFDVTDTTVSLGWVDIENALEYHIYDASSGTPVYHSKILAPASSVRISELEGGKNYSFLVRVKDSDKLLDTNANYVSATTLSAPAAPSFLVRTSPVKENDTIRDPTIVVFGTNPGDKVELFSDGCVTKVGEVTSTGSYATIKSEELSPGTTYTFHARRTNHEQVVSSCSSLSATYNLMNCPDGYISVPANPDLSIQEFCVMKYEAKPWSDSNSNNLVDSVEVNFLGCNEAGCTTKNWGTSNYIPGSNSSGNPWRMLDAETAKNECQSLGDNYDLISNLEWMTIAENIEAQDTNWSNGTVADGCLFRGNNGEDDSCGYDAGLIESGIGRSTKASMTLSNGEIIWDFSGNVTEWVDWGMSDVFTRAPVYCDDSWGDITSDFCDGLFLDTDFLPFNPKAIPTSTYRNTYGIGQIEGGPGGVITRGGAYNYDLYAGIFNASLSQSSSTAREEIGFRCVYRIPHK